MVKPRGGQSVLYTQGYASGLDKMGWAGERDSAPFAVGWRRARQWSVEGKGIDTRSGDCAGKKTNTVTRLGDEG